MIGLALEEKSASDTVKFVPSMGGEPPFPLLADVGVEQTQRYEQTTAYLVDEDGIVRQVFPMQTYARGPLDAILAECSRILSERH